VPIAQTFAAINDLHKTQYLWLALLMVWDVKQYCKGLQVSKKLWGSIKIGCKMYCQWHNFWHPHGAESEPTKDQTSLVFEWSAY
jgi:hypothetical protein